jgi:hypothetical protein
LHNLGPPSRNLSGPYRPVPPPVPSLHHAICDRPVDFVALKMRGHVVKLRIQNRSHPQVEPFRNQASQIGIN